MFTNTVKSEASSELSANVALFYANGGVVTKVKSRKKRVSLFIGKTKRSANTGQNDVFRTGSTYVA